MHLTDKKRMVLKQIICFAAAFLISCIYVVVAMRAAENPIPSLYYEDLKMPDGSSSILDEAELSADNSIVDDLHVNYVQEDPKLYLTFRRGESREIHSVEMILEESFPYDVNCVLYYPTENGDYEAEHRDEFKLLKGETEIFFEIPKDIEYEFHELRIDIDENYVIRDVLVSAAQMQGEYTFEEGNAFVLLLQYFILALLPIELLYWKRRRIKTIAAGFAGWNARTKRLLITGGAALAGNLSAFLIFRLTGRAYSSFWVLLITLCSVAVAWELALLLKRDPSGPGAKHRPKRLHILYWAFLLIFCLFLLFEWYDGMEQSENLEGLIRFQLPFLFAVAEVLLLGALYQKYVLDVQEDRISFKKIYLFTFLLLGISYMFLFLPFISPDETAHYISAYRISNLFLGQPGDWGNNRLVMRAEDYQFYARRQIVMSSDYYSKITESFRFFASDRGLVVIDGSMVTNAVFSYFTTGFGIALGRVLHLSGIMTFYLGRLMNLLFFTAVLRCLMNKIPFGRTAIFAIAMMPMTVHIAASFSYDVTTVCLVALFVTQVMCMICSPEKLSAKDYTLCVVYGALMAPSKMIYIPLLFLVLLVPWRNLSERRGEAYRKKGFVIGMSLLVMLAVMLLVNCVSADSTLRKMAEESASVNMLTWIHEPGYTVAWVLENPAEYLLMCVRTIVSMTDYYFFTMIGSKLGWLDIDLPQIYAVVSFVILMLAVNIRDEVSGQVQIGKKTKIWISVLCFGVVLSALLVMTVSWTPLSYDYILGVQGRYFTPLMLPMIWLLRNNVLAVSSAIRKHIVLVSALLNIWILVYVFAQYVVAV